MAHSAYPHLGESAIEKLLDALERVRKIPLPSDPILGASTLNIGTIQGGRAPNVIPDHAQAEIFIRLVDDGDSHAARGGRGRGGNGRGEGSAVHPGGAYGDDRRAWRRPWWRTPPIFRRSTGRWGTPYLFGPGSIHVAHTDQERIAKSEIMAAIETYQKIVRQLLQGQ